MAKKKDDRKSEVIRFRAEPDEREILQGLADDANESISWAIRKCIRFGHSAVRRVFIEGEQREIEKREK